MNTLWTRTLAVAACSVVYSHAIFGIGGHWAPAPSLEVKSSNGQIATSGSESISIKQNAVSGLNGFGLKLWIDFLPFIDIEAGSNIQYGMYDVSIIGPGTTTTPLKFDLGIPTVDKPGFARIVSDATILYPFLKLPPLVSIVKLYAGAGITQVVATEVLNAKFAKSAVDKAVATGGSTAADSPEEVSKILVEAIKDEGLKSGFGFHLELGAKAKAPIIPIAIYADAKYHFLGSMPSAVDANSMTFELGGALAF
ncbi:MAG: hypothetical protein JWP91_738 [Fibrobacteres bacterium]|nr:hypothetical protein [Fibrobacterota bacterium]